jgi:hypothetical protein
LLLIEAPEKPPLSPLPDSIIAALLRASNVSGDICLIVELRTETRTIRKNLN